MPSAFDPTPPPPAAPEAPRRWWGRHAAEIRWQAELARLLVDPVYAGRGVPRGDGAPVMLIPGFMVGDSSLSVLAGWLERMGHRPPLGHRGNVGCSDRALDALEARAERITADAGRPLALLGHSRGGHFAKALGHRRPDLVSQVVSMGAALDTPFDISIPTRAVVAAVRWVHVRDHRPRGAQRLLHRHLPLPLHAGLRGGVPRLGAAHVDLLARGRCRLVGGLHGAIRT